MDYKSLNNFAWAYTCIETVCLFYFFFIIIIKRPLMETHFPIRTRLKNAQAERKEIQWFYCLSCSNDVKYTPHTHHHTTPTQKKWSKKQTNKQTYKQKTCNFQNECWSGRHVLIFSTEQFDASRVCWWNHTTRSLVYWPSSWILETWMMLHAGFRVCG